MGAPNHQFPALKSMQIIELLLQLLLEHQLFFDMRNIQFPHMGQRQRPLVAVKQGRPYFFFYLFNRNAQGRLGDKKSFCGFGETPLQPYLVNVCFF